MSGLTSRFSVLSNPFLLGGSITASYVLLYTAYDKKTRQLSSTNLVDFFLCRRGLDWTLVEANKAISLSGLTILMASFLPQCSAIHKELLGLSMYTLWAHSVYSYYKFYQLDIRKVINDKAMKQLSIALGVLGQLSVSAGYFNQIPFLALSSASTALGLAHFYTMEIDYKYVLQVRPFAYLPFPLGVLVGYYLFVDKLFK
jgi:hypothetical protein